jgi:selenocysteine lyase/cysteine desulfurase
MTKEKMLDELIYGVAYWMAKMIISKSPDEKEFFSKIMREEEKNVVNIIGDIALERAMKYVEDGDVK